MKLDGFEQEWKNDCEKNGCPTSHTFAVDFKRNNKTGKFEETWRAELTDGEKKLTADTKKGVMNLIREIDTRNDEVFPAVKMHNILSRDMDATLSSLLNLNNIMVELATPESVKMLIKELDMTKVFSRFGNFHIPSALYKVMREEAPDALDILKCTSDYLRALPEGDRSELLRLYQLCKGKKQSPVSRADEAEKKWKALLDIGNDNVAHAYDDEFETMDESDFEQDEDYGELDEMIAEGAEEDDERVVSTEEKDFNNLVRNAQRMVRCMKNIVDKHVLFNMIVAHVEQNPKSYKTIIELHSSRDIAVEAIRILTSTTCLEWHNLIMTKKGWDRIVKIVLENLSQAQASCLGVNMNIGLNRFPTQWV